MQYTGEYLKEIVFPLGGIGSGSVGLAGNGRLMDWEIFNRPAKGSWNGYTHLAVKATGEHGSVCKVLNGDRIKDMVGQYGAGYDYGYGFGPNARTMCGFPHFKDCTFTGEFPFATIRLTDADFPGNATLFAYNPLIPLDADNSSIPAAFFEVRLENTTDQPLSYDVCFSLGNPFESSENEAFQNGTVTGIRMKHAGVSAEDKEYGDLSVSTDTACGQVTAQRYWYRGGWQDGITTFWNEFSGEGGLTDRTYDAPGKQDMGSLSVHTEAEPHSTAKVRFVLSWNVPNNYNYWSPYQDENGKDITWKNYYATKFSDSSESGTYALKNWEMLYRKTGAFHDELFSSTLPPEVIDAASATLSVIKSATVFRLENGAFYGFEGCSETDGSCEGTCQHVWNYAYALCFLFPELEQSIRDLEFQYSTAEDGRMPFRMTLPLGREMQTFRACLDGQMGSVIKIYREWKLSGNDKWLKDNWEKITRILGYAWSEQNPDEWDRNRDGVLEGRQHHTLDMELFGPSAWLEGFYLAALKAGSRMAEYLGDTEHQAEYDRLFRMGYDWTKEHLFNGKYFIQDIDLTDHEITKHFDCDDPYWNEEAGEIKYQIQNGSDIDQLCGQWHADLCGLGDIFDPEQRKTALSYMYRNNFKPSMRQFTNLWRVFAVNDESGAVICDYPEGAKRPAIPLPYNQECMHGFEYELAGLFLSHGMEQEARELVQSVRSRYNGKNRNPWNEIECGSNYARSMASFALIPLYSGFVFDLPHETIGFQPRVSGVFRTLFSVGTGWGRVEIESETMQITLNEGSLALSKLIVPKDRTVHTLIIDGTELPFTQEGETVCFDKAEIRQSILLKEEKKP